MGTHQVIITRDGQAAVERTLSKYQAAVQKCTEDLSEAEARLGRFKKFIDAMDESERERLLACFSELEAALEGSESEEVI